MYLGDLYDDPDGNTTPEAVEEIPQRVARDDIGFIPTRTQVVSSLKEMTLGKAPVNPESH